MGPLIVDLARRNGWRTALMMLVLIPMFWMGSAMDAPTRGYGISMGVAFAIGPTAIWHHPRAIWYLPISRRDIWRGSWFFATVGATLLTTAGKLAVMFVLSPGGANGLASLLLSSVYDFVYAGIGCACVIAATRPRPARAPWRQLATAGRGLAEIALALGTIVAFYSYGLPATHWADLVIRNDVLPAHWTDLTMRSGTALVAALALTIGTYFHSPSPPARIPDGGFLFRSAVGVARTPRRTSVTPRFEHARLSGLPRLLVHEYVWTILLAGGLAAASGIAGLAVAIGLQSQQTVPHFLAGELLAFDGTVPLPQGGGLDAFVASLFWYALFGASLAARFPAMLRHLRVLPLSGRQVNALLVAWPAVTWLTVWTGLVALHYVVVGRGVSSWHVAFFVALAGSSALVQALTLRLSGVLRLFCFCTAGGVVPLLGQVNAPAPGLLALLGTGGLAAAAVLNHAALRRSSTYRPLGPVSVAHGPGA